MKLRVQSMFLLLLLIGLTPISYGMLYRPVHVKTLVGGRITQDTIWTSVYSPYLARNDVIVNPGVDLTLMPGVEVQFDDDFSFIVQGSLRAVGTVNDPIVFTSSRSLPASGAWETIRFNGDGNESLVMSHVLISYAKNGLTIDEAVGTAVIEKCVLSQHSESAICLIGNLEVLVIENIINLSLNGISIRPESAFTQSNTGLGSMIIYNTISECENGINFYCTGLEELCNLTISNNIIKYNTGMGIYAYANGDIYNTSITDNVISRNGGDAVHFNSFSNGSMFSDIVISKNTLASNQGNGIFLLTTHGFGGTIRDILISDNNVTSNAANGIHLLREAGTLENISILNNSIAYNSYGVLAEASTKSTVYFNSIYGNDKGMAILESATIDAEGNYWDDYIGLDDDGDGIGNTPYVIDENNQDNYPLMNPVDSSTILEFPSESTIYIRNDGSVEGTDLIQRDGDVYTLISDISGSIVVERDNVVLDGARYRLQGEGNQNGTTLRNSNNITVKNFVLSSFNIGIVVMGSDNNTILENSITDNFLGLDLTDSENNTVSGNYIANNSYGIALENMYNNISKNIVTNNSDIGIFLYGAEYNNIIGNNITINGRGILVSICSDNVIHHNNFINNTKQVYDIAWDNPEMSPSVNTWYSPESGNYWSDYNGEGAYVIDVNNQDNFPTKKPFRIPHQLNAQEDFTLSNIFWSVIIMAVVGIFLLVYFRRPRNI